jgi:hypothetical protein
MKDRGLNSDVHKEFHHRPASGENKPTIKNLPNLELFENDVLKKQQVQKSKKSSEPLKHMSMMFPWDLYVKLVEYSHKTGMTVTDTTVEALKQYLLEKTTHNQEIEKLNEKVRDLKSERSGGEHEFDTLEKTINKEVQKIFKS